MNSSPPTPRPKVVCLFQKADAILVSRIDDRINGDVCWGLPGGGIEFGEKAVETAVREMQEELGAKVRDARLLTVVENLFDFEGRPGHEITFVVSATFEDPSLYDLHEIRGVEDGHDLHLTWEPLASFATDRRLVPAGLYDRLHD